MKDQPHCTEWSGCVASFPGPHSAFCNSGNEEAGEREHVFGVCICPISTVSKWLTVSKWWTIPKLNRKELEMQRSELFWSLSGTHTFLFFRLQCHHRVQQLFNLANVLMSKFFTGQTGWQTNKNLLTPLRMHARGNYKQIIHSGFLRGVAICKSGSVKVFVDDLFECAEKELVFDWFPTPRE